jgi:hypothetical protein
MRDADLGGLSAFALGGALVGYRARKIRFNITRRILLLSIESQCGVGIFAASHEDKNRLFENQFLEGAIAGLADRGCFCE